jgi:hypothetical protein
MAKGSKKKHALVTPPLPMQRPPRRKQEQSKALPQGIRAGPVRAPNRTGEVAGVGEGDRRADCYQHRMRNAEFHAQGLCTSTGVVEAGCKVAIGTRLKRSGMRWTTRGADVIIAIRCYKLSSRFEDFWERRAVRRAA